MLNIQQFRRKELPLQKEVLGIEMFITLNTTVIYLGFDQFIDKLS